MHYVFTHIHDIHTYVHTHIFIIYIHACIQTCGRFVASIIVISILPIGVPVSTNGYRKDDDDDNDESCDSADKLRRRSPVCVYVCMYVCMYVCV